MLTRTFLCLALFLLVYSTHSEEVCYTGELASWHLKKWTLSENKQLETFSVKYFESDLTLVREEEGPSWYLVDGGWQGIFYYETGEPGESRAGAYLYPDFSTAIVGLWIDHLLLQGKATQVGEICQSGKTWKVKFQDMVGPIISYSPPSHYSLGVNPLLRDAYEDRTVEVRQSGIPGAQEGLFARRNILPGEVVSFYNGYIITCSSSLRGLDRRDLSDEEEHIRNMYNMAMDLEDGGDLCIDIPPDIGNSIERYNATLGHKVNHSFQPNSEFALFSVHPILGTIMSLVASQDISIDQEITVHYGYNYTRDPDQPQWFINQWNQHYADKSHDEL